MTDEVASVCRHPKLIIYYTDEHDVDEDWVTLTVQGGAYPQGISDGMSERYLNLIPSQISNYVAYKDKNTILADRMVFLMI